MTTARKVRVSTDLELNAEDFLESAVGIIGKRGGGKSGGVKVIMEELVGVGLPFVAFDPVGIMWGIKSSLDGKSEGLPVLVIGGSHGDLKLNRRAGAEVAAAVVQANISCVIDFSEEPKAAYREFVRDFCHRLFTINETPRLVILEEAPELVPQKLRPDMMEVFESVERLVSRGRNKGIGVIMVSQRAATINKDVLTQVDALMVFGLTSPQDRKALTEWVEAWDQQGRIKEFEAGLAGLRRQEAWFWAPTLFKQGGIFQKIRIRDFKTFHPDKTHLRRSGLLEQKPVTTDVSGIIKKLGAQLEKFSKEKAEVAAVPKLQARIHQLEKDLERARAAPSQGLSRPELRQQVHKATAPLLKEIHELKQQLRSAATVTKLLLRVKQVLAEVPDIGTHKGASFGSHKGTPMSTHLSPSNRTVNTECNRRDNSKCYSYDKLARPDTEDSQQLKKGAIKMLRELASRSPLTLTRAQLGTLAGFTPSGGTFASYFSTLKRLGYLEEDSGRNVRVTESGLEFIGEVPPAPSTHEEIMAMWARNLKSGAMRMLQVLVDNYAESVSKGDLAEFSGFEVSGGTFSSYLSILKRNGLIEVRGDEVRAKEVLFP